MFAAQVRTRNSKAVVGAAVTKRRPRTPRATTQRTVGYEALGRLLPSPQTELSVSQPGDPAELEAESAAAQVMANADADLAPASADPQHGPTAGRDDTEGMSADASIPAHLRRLMEARFGWDFSHVRIHHDAAAKEFADAFDARALTVGRDIFFAQNQFAPTSHLGQRLIAHELAHVVQQGAVGASAGTQLATTGVGLMRQAAVTPTTPTGATETFTPVPEEETGTDDEDAEEGAVAEISLEIGFALPTLVKPKTNVATPRIDRQPRGRTRTPKRVTTKRSGLTIGPVQVLPHRVGDTEGGTDGDTRFKIRDKIRYRLQGGKISSFSGKVSRTIQTTFRPGVNRAAKSAYGRGTTDADKQAGNTSLQFHESCHAQDYRNYFSGNRLPEFNGKIGMSEDDFKAAVDKYEQDLGVYSDAARDSSQATTDCVGVKGPMCQ